MQYSTQDHLNVLGFIRYCTKYAIIINNLRDQRNSTDVASIRCNNGCNSSYAILQCLTNIMLTSYAHLLWRYDRTELQVFTYILAVMTHDHDTVDRANLSRELCVLTTCIISLRPIMYTLYYDQQKFNCERIHILRNT